MVSQTFPTPFMIGLFIGFCGSLIGALIDFVNSRRSKTDFNPGGLMIIVAGLINTLLGTAAIIYSLIVTGSIITAVIVGLGVLSGFAAGFLLIAGVWIWFGNKNELA
jgi:hypothetical protein